MLRLLAIPIGLLILLAGTLTWSASKAVPRAQFTFINRGDIITLDLNQMSYMQDFRITYGIREGLYNPDPKTLDPMPAGAERFELSEDKRIWTFHLRKSARWSNGDPVRAQDYVFSWRRMLEEPGEYTYLFYYVKNARAYEDSYTKGEPLAWKEVGIEAVDDFTFRVTLNDPVPYLLELLAFPPFYPRHEKSMAEFREFSDRDLIKSIAMELERQKLKLAEMPLSDVLAALPAMVSNSGMGAVEKDQLRKVINTQCLKYTFRNEYTRPPKVVTNGAFVLDRWEFKRALYLKRSPTYWDTENVRLDSIQMVVNDNVLSQFLQYEAHAVDWLSDVPVDMARDLKAKGRTDLRSTKAFGTAFITLMVAPNLPKSILGGAKNPLADVRVRQALALAMDKAGICRDVTGMGEEVASTFVPPGTLKGYTPTPALGYDLVKAKQLLADAGYPGGAGFPRLPILYNAGNPTRERLVQVLAKQWESNLGLQFDLQRLEVKEYRNRITEKNYAIGTAAWYGDYPDVTTFTDKYLSTSLQNDCDWKNEKYDGLCAQAAKEPDPVKRLVILNEAELLLNTEVPIIPIYYYVNCSMRREGINNLGENPRNVTVFKHISIDGVSRDGSAVDQSSVKDLPDSRLTSDKAVR